MPFTPFHMVPVWPLYVGWPRRWDVLALSLGAMVPDLETVTAAFLAADETLGRGLLHSVLGVLTLNLVLALLGSRVLVPRVAIRLDRRYPGRGWRRFAGRDFVADRKPLGISAHSAVVGGVSHLALDLLHHVDTPLLWPWREVPLHVGPWAPLMSTTIAMNVVAGALFLAIAIRWVGR